jgi:ribonucleases P/MRP protein subunit RPP40
LQNRKQYTRIGNQNSDLGDITCGVPQGSVLGPILFLIYVNGLFSLNLKGKIQLYADDAVILYSEKTFDDLYVSMSQDLNILKNWFTINRLSMNIEKTKFIIYETKNSNNLDRFDEVWVDCEKISRVEHYKYLGLWIDHKMKFSMHILNLKKSIAPIVGVLKRVRPYVVPEVLNNLYFSYIHSRFSYLISVWGMAAHENIKTLQYLQNKSLKNLRQLPFRFPTKQLYSNTILPLDKLRELEMILIVYKIIKGTFKFGDEIVYRFQIHGYNTRNSRNINLPLFRLSMGRKSFHFEVFDRFNNVPQHIQECNNLKTFKFLVKSRLYNEYNSSN